MDQDSAVVTPSEYLRALAARVVEPFPAIATLLAGSAAHGTSDEWSDIDVVLFYDSWPGASALERARESLGGSEYVLLGGTADGDVLLEQFRVDGVACQLVHQTEAAWRVASAGVLERFEAASPVQKALSGLHEGIVLRGVEFVEARRSEAAYPEGLRAAMVESGLDVFPLWRMQDALSRRDAELWQRGELAAGLQKVLAMLAGVNRVYFSTFQLKHARQLVASFRHAPEDLAARIDGALRAPTMGYAADELERLVDETLTIVERELPDVDLARLRRHVGARLDPWTMSE